ncbi:conserved hypothetical protein [Alteracholeplasma palmae J233]|uniref:Uncharacterized protein n=1 Tax=Alteracholeplasma palmae (strain ATCC 49389 / J233) TaxID=1318466 RepID=U4KLI8_ALTPJ|nr:hypothetical protein [Alteracholeplasma palmae]CCV64708.1 conserved hypothetical protein [Alteracholeplasma palmae J233]
MKPNLEENIIKKFRDLVNSSKIFYKSDKHENNWNMICAFMDRIDDSIKVLNTREYLTDGIGDPVDVISFIVQVDIVVESISKLFKKLGIDNPLKDDFSIFNNVGDGRGSDDKFFKHIRALSFAHSISTDHASPYIEKQETQYSPFILNGSGIDQDKVIIMVYSTINEKDNISLRIPKKQFIKYVESRYNLISCLIQYIEEEIRLHKEERISDVIDISKDPIETLNNIKNAAIKRYDEALIDHIDEVIYTLEYKSGIVKNQEAVNQLKLYIIPYINEFVSLYQKMDDTAYEHSFYSVLDFNWITENSMSSYILSKIGSYLNEEMYGPNIYNFDINGPYDPKTPSNVEWGFQQLDKFKLLLADKYVDIDYKMPFKEIQLLVTTALFIDNLAKGKLKSQ